jgi:hypothetical protein
MHARDRLRKWPLLARLQRHHRCRGGEIIEHLGGMFDGTAREHWRQDPVDQPRTMLGAGGRKIAPDLAPAMRAVLVLRAHEHGLAIVHPAERRHDWG